MSSFDLLSQLSASRTRYGFGVCMFLYAIILRLSVGLHPYSGAGKPPMYGDYEAQRHWMEITVHLKPNQWYVNSSDNDLNYWGLDYPPLTAYHSWICGIVAHWIKPDWVALHISRGIEDYHHKLFMRYTVLTADIFLYFPAIFVFVFTVYRSLSLGDRLCVVCLLLTLPSLILIDHGHFQYNSVSLGLTVLAIVSVFSHRDVLCCIFFSLALNYKQMELYHALPFFCFLLGKALQKDKWYISVIKYGICVVLTFLICWLPFLTSTALMKQVLHRLFPFERGLYEDKVANIWCSLSVIIKLKQLIPRSILLQLSLWTTLVANVPSSFNLLRNPTPYRFLHALVNSSLSFFLFSFQVHEKSILLAAVPVSLLAVVHPFMCTWFSLVATFSMYPLLVKDGLAVPTWSLCLIFYILSHLLLPHFQYKNDSKPQWIKQLFYVSMVTLLSVCALSHVVTPPKKLPDLFPVLISGLSCVHFLAFLVWFTLQQYDTQFATYQKFSKFVLGKSN